MALSWSDISSQAWFTELAPEQKAKALDVWTQDTLSSVTDPAERDQLEAASEFGKLKYLGQPLPAQSLEEFVPIFQEQKRLKAADEQGLLTQLGGALQTGLRDVTTGLGVTFDALTGDNEELAQGLAAMNETDAVRQQNKTTQDIQFEKALAENAQQFKDAKGFWPTTKELADYVGITLSNPTAFAKMVAESAPNALVSIGAQAVGAGVGALAAGAGGGVATGGAGAIPAAFAGGTAGAVAANVPLEIPGSIRQKFLEVTKGEGAKMTPEQIKQVLDANPEIVSEGALKGTVRGTAIGVVEGLTAGVAGKVATIPERAAERAVLAETAKRLGKEAATRLDAADYILKNPGAKDALAEVASKALSDFTVGQRVAGLAGAGLIETAGEGAGELAAQVATGEEIDPTAIYQEVAVGAGMALPAATLARSIEPARQIVQRINAIPELQAEKQNLAAAENLVQQAAADPNTVASVAAAKAVINQGDQSLVDKAATAVAQEFQVSPDITSGITDLGEAEGDIRTRIPLQAPQGAELPATEAALAGQPFATETPFRPTDLESGLTEVPPISPADITAGLEPQPPTQTTEDATLQGQVPENRIEERVQADEGGPTAGPGSRDQPEGSGQVQAEVQTDEVAPTTELPNLEEGYLPKAKSTVRVNRSIRKESRMTIQRDLKFGSSGKAVPLQGVGNDKRSSMLLSKLLTVFGGKKGNTGVPDPSRIISINPNSDQAIVEDKDGILKLFAAGGDGDTWMYIADVEPTIPPQGVVPTESLPEGQVTPGGAAVPSVRDTTKPEQMTPEESYEAYTTAKWLAPNLAEMPRTKKQIREGIAIAENSGIKDPKLQRMFMDLAKAETAQFAGLQIQGQRIRLIEEALEEQKPVSAEAVDTYGITLPEGYVRQGDLYVFAPEAAAPAAPAAPQISPEIRNTLQAEIASLPPVAQTRWTPDVVADAESYIQTGNQDAYKRLTRPQQNLVNRVRERLGITDEQDAQEAEMERQMRLDANTKGSPYRNQIEQSIDLPAGQDLGLVSEADFEAGMRIVEGLIRNARATVIQDTRANLLASADLNEAEKDAFRRGAQGIYSRGRAIIARDNIRATSFTASPAQAAAAVVFHELMHKGSDILKSDPRFAQEYAEWLQMLNENVTDDMIRDVVARTGYRNMADWQTNPTSKLRAQEEVFVRQMERFFQRGGRLAPAQAGLLARFKEWIGRVVERALGTPIAGNLRDDILQDWGRKFIKAVQSSNAVSDADLAASIEFPAAPTPETRTGVDRISTFDEDEKAALRSFMKGDQGFDKLKQFLGVEEGGELGRTESLLPLKMAAIDTIGFSEDKSGAPVVSKRATENAFEIARQLLDPTTNFGVTYQQEVGEGAESAATAVLQMELTRYALAMARKGDNRLLATMRQNWNSVVLGAYITATASGRILRARVDYVSDVLRTIDKMDAEAKKQAKKRLQSLGMDEKEAETTVRDLDAVIQQTQLTEEELNTLVQDMLKTAEGRNFENTNPPDDWVGRAVSKLGEDDQRMVSQLFRQLFELDQIEKKLAEVSKSANGPEASFLDSFVTDDVALPDSVEELEQLRDKTKKNISDLLSKLTKRADANPEVARKVKEATKKTPAPVTDEVSDFIKKYEDKLKKPISKKKTQAELDLEKLVRDQVKVPLSEADFITEASVFGATEAQARRLYNLARVEASLLTAERGKTPTKLGKLVRYLQSVPSMAKDPQGRSLAIESFLRDNGYTDEQINRSKEYLEKAVSESMVKAKQAALDRMISRAEKKTQQKLAKKAEEDLATRLGGITGKAREILMRDLKTIRSGLGDKETDPSMKLAEALGFSGFRPNDYKSLAELDIKITQANLEGRLHDASEGVRELYELLGRRKAPKNLIEQLGIAYNYGALSSLGSLAIQVISPLGAFVTRFTMDMTRALARRDVNLMKLTVKSFIDSMKRVPLEAAYGLKGGASTVTMNQQVFAVTRLSREMSDAADTLMRRGRQSPESRTKRGLPPRPNALEMVKAGYSWLLTSSQIIGRVLSTADHVANNMMKNYFTKTEAAKALLAGTDMPYEAMVARLFNISTTVNAQLSYEKDSLARLAMEMKQLKEDGKYSKAALLDLLAAPLPEGLSQSAQDFERDLRGNLRRVVEAYDTVPKLERHILREMSRQKTAAETRANDRMRVELLRDIEGRVTPQAAAQVQDFAAKETDYEMGTHRGENAPTADIFNTFTNLVRDVGQSVKSRHPLLGTMVLGYFGIPVNLLNRAMWFTPWGLVRAGLFKNAQRNGLTKDTYYQMSMATTAQFQQRLMEAIGGTAAVALLMALKDMDEDEDEGFNVTLSGPSNKTEFDAWSKQGHRKGSLEYVSKDGTVTSLNWARGLFEPLKVALLMVGAMDDMRLNRKIGEQATGLATTISEYLSAVLYGWSKQAAFFGAKNTIGTFLAPAVDSNAVAGSLYKLGPLVPYNGLISSVEKFIAGPDRFYGREGAIWLNLPIARSLMTERAVNALGDPQGFVANTNWSDLNDRAWYAGMPLMVTGSPTGNDKKVYDFILQRGTGPGLPQRGNLEEKNGLMSDTKWLEFVRTRGQILKTDMIRNMPRLEALDDEALTRAYSDMSEQATRIAKRRMGFQ